VGCTTPGSGIKIERASLRGVDSFGMLCSAYDIGWVPEPDGVLAELPDDADVGEECPEEPPEVRAGPPCASSATAAPALLLSLQGVLLKGCPRSRCPVCTERVGAFLWRGPGCVGVAGSRSAAGWRPCSWARRASEARGGCSLGYL
jgi:hypothetical protein